MKTGDRGGWRRRLKTGDYGGWRRRLKTGDYGGWRRWSRPGALPGAVLAQPRTDGGFGPCRWPEFE